MCTGNKPQSFLLELIQTLLPSSVALDTYLDTTEDLFLTTLEIYSELDDISVVDRICATLHAWAAKSDVVEKGSGAALDIFDEPLSVLEPQLAVPTTDNLALETNRGG